MKNLHYILCVVVLLLFSTCVIKQRAGYNETKFKKTVRNGNKKTKTFYREILIEGVTVYKLDTIKN